MRGHEGDPQLTGQQQHDGQSGTGSSRQIFGVARELEARVHDDALLHRCRHHGGEFAIHADVAGAIQQFDDIGRIAQLQTAGGHLMRGRPVQNSHGSTAMRGGGFRCVVVENAQRRP